MSCISPAIRRLLAASFIVVLCGCGLFRRPQSDFEIAANNGTAVGEGPALMPNPLYIPGGEREFVWNQLVDELDDYFVIQREERIQSVGGVLTEGTIVTRPKTGSTYLEPWRKDSTPGFERLHATFQSIRRTARVRLIPVENGYLLNVLVHKELEDVDKPIGASAGAVIQRHDSSLVREQVPPGIFSITPGWISQGRDVSLEQRILSNIRGRLDELNTPFKDPPQGAYTDY